MRRFAEGVIQRTDFARNVRNKDANLFFSEAVDDAYSTRHLCCMATHQSAPCWLNAAGLSELRTSERLLIPRVCKHV